MKKLIFILFSLLFIMSCTTKNLFYGIDAEDIQGPDIFVDYPDNSITQSGTFTLIGRAQDNGGNDVLKIEVLAEGSTSWTTYKVAIGTTNWSINVDTLGAWGAITGDRSLTIKASDTNYKTNSTTKMVTYHIDNSNPSVFSVVDNNDLGNDKLRYNGENGNVIDFQWANEGAGANNYLIKLYEDNINIGQVQIPNGSSGSGVYSFSSVAGVVSITHDLPIGGTNSIQFSYTAPNLNGHSYYLVAVPRDVSNNEIITAQSDIIVIDTVAPNTAVVTDPGLYTNDPGYSVLFTWNSFVDPDPDGAGPLKASGISYYEVESCDGMIGAVPTTCDVGNDAHWSATPTFIAGTLVNTSGYGVETFNEGETVVLRVRAVDKAGNRSVWSTSDGVTIQTTIGNVGAITDDSGDGAKSNGETRTIQFTWTDVANSTGYTIQVYETVNNQTDDYIKQAKNVGALGNGTNTGITGVDLSTVGVITTFQFTAPGDGRRYLIRVKANDDAGNESAVWATSNTIIVDIDNPSTGTVDDNSNPGTYSGVTTTANTVTFTWSGFIDDVDGSGVVKYQYQSTTTGGVYNSTFPPTTSCAGAMGWAPAIPGETTGTSYQAAAADGNIFCFRVRAVDGAGNVSAWATSDGILSDQTPPVITDMWPGVNGAGDSFKRPMLAEQGNLDANNNRFGRIYWDDSTDTGSGIDYYEVEVTHSCGEVCYFNYQVRADRIGAASLLSYTQYRLTGTSIVNTASTALGNDTDTLAPADGKYLDFEFTNGEFGCTYSTVIIRVYDKAGNMTQSFISDELNI